MNAPLKLLLLEDDPSDAELIQTLLKRSGMKFSAKVASDEKEFLKALGDNNGFDAVLADNALPQYSSMEALRLLKQTNPFVAFILVTGTVSEEFAVHTIHLGADDYILKTNLTRLPAAINKAVENKMMQKEKYKSEKEMQELNEQLRNLAAHLQNVREEEQTRIAREIHDELGQMLTTIKMDISRADNRLGRSITEVKGYLSQAVVQVDKMVTAVRRIASELRPSILDDLGLVSALEWQIGEFKRHNTIEFHFTAEVPDDDLVHLDFEKDIAIGLYRIFQEALTNIAKHSDASKVTANIGRYHDQLILMIYDNGKGFDTENTKDKKSFGLVGMKERALMMKGEFIAESTAGKGTTITVAVPFDY
jgi:signal transduction histidine kinase